MNTKFNISCQDSQGPIIALSIELWIHSRLKLLEFKKSKTKKVCAQSISYHL